MATTKLDVISDSALVGRKVLFLPKSKLFIPLLKTAKERWGWHIDVLYERGDPSRFEELVGPTGTIFKLPDTTRPAAWETDPEAVAAVDQRLWRAELAARMPIGRIVLADAAATSGGLRQLGCEAWRDLLGRQASSGRQYGAAQTRSAPLLRRRRYPCEIGAGPRLGVRWKPVRFTAWLAATGRSIPCVAFPRSKILSDRGYCTAELLMFNTAARERSLDRRNSEVVVSDAAKAYVQGFRERPKTVKYIQTRWQRTSKSMGRCCMYNTLARKVANKLCPLRYGASDAVAEVRSRTDHQT